MLKYLLHLTFGHQVSFSLLCVAHGSLYINSHKPKKVCLWSVDHTPSLSRTRHSYARGERLKHISDIRSIFFRFSKKYLQYFLYVNFRSVKKIIVGNKTKIWKNIWAGSWAENSVKGKPLLVRIKNSETDCMCTYLI